MSFMQSGNRQEIGEVVIGIFRRGGEIREIGSLFPKFEYEVLKHFPRREVRAFLEGLVERGFLTKAPFFETVADGAHVWTSQGTVYSVSPPKNPCRQITAALEMGMNPYGYC